MQTLTVEEYNNLILKKLCRKKDVRDAKESSVTANKMACKKPKKRK